MGNGIVVVIVKGFTVTDNVKGLEATLLWLSVTWIVILIEAVLEVCPPNTPALENVNPAFKLPAIIAQVYPVPEPPVAFMVSL